MIDKILKDLESEKNMWSVVLQEAVTSNMAELMHVYIGAYSKPELLLLVIMGMSSPNK